MSSPTDITTTVHTVLARVLKVPADQVDSIERATHDTWTSLAHVEIMFSLEDEFGIVFDGDAVALADTADELIELIQARLAP